MASSVDDEVVASSVDDEVVASDDDDDEAEEDYFTCESCQLIENMELKEEHDDADFEDEEDDFKDDEKLRLRVIHYRRKIWLSGCFDVDCPPGDYWGIGGQPHSGLHYANSERFKQTVVDCARFAVDSYNEKKEGEELELVDVDNVAVEGCGWLKFYLTIRCKDIGKRVKILAGESANSEKTYRVVVSCCYWKREEKRMLIFRDSDGKHLLEPDSYFDHLTQLKTRRPCPPDWKPKESS